MMQFMVWMSIAIMLLIYLGKYFILHTVFGSIEADVMANCNTYLLISAASIPFLGVYCGGAALSCNGKFKNFDVCFLYYECD